MFLISYRKLPNLRNFLTLEIDQNTPKFLELGDVKNNNIMVFDLIEECPSVRKNGFLQLYVGGERCVLDLFEFGAATPKSKS